MFRAVAAIGVAACLQVVSSIGAEAQTAGAGQTSTATASRVTSHFTVQVPLRMVELRVQDRVIQGTDTTLEVDTPPLEPGREYEYTLVLDWAPNAYTVMTRTKAVRFRAGDRVVVDLTTEQPTDRARIRWVTT